MGLTMIRARTSAALAAVAALALAACGGKRAFTRGEYTDPTEIDLLSDEWAPSDLQLIAKKMVESLQSSGSFAAIQGRPVVVVGKLRNSTSEHIDMQSLGDKIQTGLGNTGKFQLTDQASRKAVAEEYEYQQSGYVKPDSAKGPGQQIGADYIFTGELASIKQAVGRDEFIYYKMTGKLTNLKTGILEWSDEKELKKKFQKRSIVP
jgi:uncharacterized protein (TIGR02722 family)